MANDQNVNLIGQGKTAWNTWRERNPFEKPDFRSVNIPAPKWATFNFREADFRRAILRGAEFMDCDLSGANFGDADVSGANFRGAKLDSVDFSNADLSRANFYRASFVGAIISGANLFAANLRESVMGQTIIANVDLETVTGLDEIEHRGSSSLAVDALYQSAGRLPDRFLKSMGFPQMLIDYVPSLVGAESSIQFHSCFISYSHNDEYFAQQLWARMRKERIRVWYAPEEMRGGKKLFDQIDRAIQLHDKLLLVLSEFSLKSGWVQTEIRRALRQTSTSSKRKLFPIRLADFDLIKSWECLDADSGRDLAIEVREFFIPDFSRWREENEFEDAFSRLRKDLRAVGVHTL